MACTACSHTHFSGTSHHSIVTCNGCGGVQGTVTVGDVTHFVHLHRWHTGEALPEDLRFFDFTLLGSAGVSRSHGWFHRVSRNVVQFG